MMLVPLSQLPNQTVAFNVDGAYWEIHLFQAVDKMYADISRDGVLLISSTRCLSGIGLLPYKHLHEPLFGNFVFDNLVDWTTFGTSCKLYYANLEEWQQYRELLKVN